MDERRTAFFRQAMERLNRMQIVAEAPSSAGVGHGSRARVAGRSHAPPSSGRSLYDSWIGEGGKLEQVLADMDADLERVKRTASSETRAARDRRIVRDYAGVRDDKAAAAEGIAKSTLRDIRARNDVAPIDGRKRS